MISLYQIGSPQATKTVDFILQFALDRIGIIGAFAALFYRRPLGIGLISRNMRGDS